MAESNANLEAVVKSSVTEQPKKTVKSTSKKATKSSEIPIAKRKDIRLRMYSNNDWRVKLPRGVTLKQAEDPAYIAKVLSIGSQDFRSFDQILAVAHDASWATELMVVDAGTGWVDVQVHRTHQFKHRREQGEARIPTGYSVHRCPHEGTWYAQRDTDGVRLVEGLNNREEATRGLLDHAVFRNH